MRNSPQKITVAAIQLQIGSDPTEHLAKVERLVRESIQRGAGLICLPELFHGPYFCQTEDTKWFSTAEPVPGPLTQSVLGWIAGHDITLIAPIFERRAPGLFHNSAAILHGTDGLVGVYRKMHIPDDPGFYEKYYFTPGDADPGFGSWDCGGARFGVAICWDQWFPEAARLTALTGAEILFYPTAIGWHPREKAARGAIQHEAWEMVQRSHAITNGTFVVAVNRIGHEVGETGDGIEFWGRSFIAAPDGSLVCKAEGGGDEILLAELDLGLVEQHRIEWPFLRDRRVDAYGNMGKRMVDPS